MQRKKGELHGDALARKAEVELEAKTPPAELCSEEWRPSELDTRIDPVELSATKDHE